MNIPKYILVDPKKGYGDSYSWYFRIKSGKYKGTVYRYDTIKLGEVVDGMLQFSFGCTVVRDPHKVNTTPGSEFMAIAGNIFADFIPDHFDEMISGATRKENIKSARDY